MKKLLLLMVGFLSALSSWAAVYEWSYDGQKGSLSVTAAKGEQSLGTYSGYEISYGGSTYTKCVKMESATTLTFTTSKTSTITVGVALKDKNTYADAEATRLSLTTTTAEGALDPVKANTGITSSTTGSAKENGLSVVFGNVPAGTQVIKRDNKEEGVFYIMVEEADASKTATPQISAVWGDSYMLPTIVSISCTTNDATIYYTLDGSTPTASSAKYESSLSVTSPCTVSAIAIASGLASSSVATQAVTINDKFKIGYDFSAVTLTQGGAVESTTSSNNAAYTLPLGRLYYIDGMTQTGWAEGSSSYALGEKVTVTGNHTFVPVFADNTVALGDAAATVNWTFATSEGAPLAGVEGKVAYYAAQTMVNGQPLDVVMTIDATKDAGIAGSQGKWNTTSADNRAQVNKGTKFTIPALKGMTVKYAATNGNPSSSSVTFAGENGEVDGKTVVYTYNGDAKTIDIIDQGDNLYPSGICVAYPAAGESGPVEEEAVKYAISAQPADAAQGSAALYDIENNLAAAEVEKNDTVTAIAVPAAGYYFKNWTVDGNVVSASYKYGTRVNAAMNLVANFAAQVAEPAGNKIFSWVGAADGAAVTGTVATAADNADRVNYANANDGKTYYTICLNGKVADIDSKTYVDITPVSPFYGGEVIALTGYYNKATDAKCSIAFKYDNGTLVKDETELQKIQNVGAPVTMLFTVPAEAAGSQSLRITRNLSGTNAFFTEVAIYQTEVPAYTITAAANDETLGTVTSSLADATAHPGTKVTLTATPAEGCEFVGWMNGDDMVSADAEYSFFVAGNVSLVAKFVEGVVEYAVNAVPAEVANGSVSLVDAENNEVAGNVVAGTKLTAVAKAAAGYYFVSWTVGEEVVSNSFTYAFEASSDMKLVANFAAQAAEPAGEKIFSWVGGEEGATVTGSVETAASNANRVNYLNGANGVNYYTICLNGKIADVDKDNYVVLNTTKPFAGGEVIAMTGYYNKDGVQSCSAAFKYENGTVVKDETKYMNILTVGSPVTMLYIVPAEAVGSNSVKITRNLSGTNIFLTEVAIYQSEVPSYSVVAQVNDSKLGSVEAPAAAVAAGTTVTVKAVAAEKAEFKGWTIGAETVSVEPEYTFVVKGNTTLVANFEKTVVEYAVSATAGANGSVALNTGATVEEGTTVIATATPKAGYQVQAWTVNGTPVLGNTSNTMECVVNENTQIAVSFSKIPEFAKVNVSAYKYATFSSTKSLDFTGSEVKAYIATTAAGNIVTLKRVYQVPANTGLLLSAAAGSYDISVVEDVPSIEDQNYFVAVTADVTIGETSGASTNCYLTPDLNGKNFGFYPVYESQFIGAGKAYLSAPLSFVTSASVNLVFEEEDDEATEIAVVGAEKSADNVWYNINGAQVKPNKAGVYVNANGNKYVVK